jgi:hypothetical protein
MMQVTKSLEGIAGSIKMIELPVPQKEDVSYYLEQGHTKEELVNLVKNTSGLGYLGKHEDTSLLEPFCIK